MKSLNEEGVWGVHFYGVNADIIVDDYLMFNKGTDDLFGAESTQNELWVSILEKAYAKYLGSYGKIWGGTPAHPMQNLLGFPTREETFDFYDKEVEGGTEALMIECYVKGFPMTATIGSK